MNRSGHFANIGSAVNVIQNTSKLLHPKAKPHLSRAFRQGQERDLKRVYLYTPTSKTGSYLQRLSTTKLRAYPLSSKAKITPVHPSTLALNLCLKHVHVQSNMSKTDVLHTSCRFSRALNLSSSQYMKQSNISRTNALNQSAYVFSSYSFSSFKHLQSNMMNISKTNAQHSAHFHDTRCGTFSALNPCFKHLQSNTSRRNNILHQSAHFHTSCRSSLLHHQQPSLSSTSTHSSTSSRVEVDDQPPSWLFVSPAAAGAYGAQVNVDLDLEERLSGDSLRDLEVNIKSRGMCVDIAGLLENFKELKRMQEEKAALLVKKEGLLNQFKELKGKESTEDLESTRLHLGGQMRAVKAEISALKSSWDLEEQVMLEALKLPNHLCSSTPLEEPKIVQEVKPETGPVQSPSHVEIAQKFDLVKFSNVGPKAYYLKGEVALAEMALTSAVCDHLQARGFRHISGPEFVKTPIVEGCGGDVRDGNEVLTMIDPHKTVVEPMNHISGVSLHMFAAYVAKTCVGEAALPLQMFACGRSYHKSNLPGLFGAIQTTQAGLFSCVKEEDVDQQYESCVSLVWDILVQLDFHLRLIQVPATDLGREEKRRADFEMFSPSLQQFIPVAKVSDVGDFVSRRLMVTHNQNHADIRTARRLHMVHGVAVNITSLLALWMEHSYAHPDAFSLRQITLVQNPTKFSS